MAVINLTGPLPHPVQRSEEEEKELQRMNASAAPRRIVLLVGSANDAPAVRLAGDAAVEAVLEEPSAADIHRALVRLSMGYHHTRLLAAERLERGAWVRWLWRRGDK